MDALFNHSLSTGSTILLFACLLLALGFEFVNGFHDTANAVATVIYTNSLKPRVAVIISGIFNANSGSTSGAGSRPAMGGSGAGKRSMAMRRRTVPSAGSSTIGPGHSSRQSSGERCRRSKFSRCGQ